MRNLLSANEIAALGLPGLPKSKVGVRTLAEREGWYHEEKKGVGGTRRVYELPAQYVPSGEPLTTPEKGVAKVTGTIVAGSAKVDPAKLELAMRALNEWEKERNVKVDEERRPAVISILYDYLQNAEGDGTAEMAVVLRALG